MDAHPTVLGVAVLSDARKRGVPSEEKERSLLLPTAPGTQPGTRAEATPNCLRLHTAGCDVITGVPRNGIHWTVHAREPCGARSELEKFAAGLGGQGWECPICL
jgi:hypothetical protein